MTGIDPAKPLITYTPTTTLPCLKTGHIASADITPANSTGDVEHKISPHAQQLSEALQRAQQREIKLDRPALNAYAKTVQSPLTGPQYHALKWQHDAALPNTTTPEILARAKQATDYENGTASNPFKGMSAELLTAIIYDDSGTFTINERRAAWSESCDQHQAWALKVIAEANAEYDRTGFHTKIYEQVLARYRSQPLIEQAQFPQDYEQTLVSKRDQALRLADKPPAKVSVFDMIRAWRTQQPRLTTLFSMLAGTPEVNERLPTGRGATFKAWQLHTAAPEQHRFARIAKAPAAGASPANGAALLKDLTRPASSA